MHLSFLPQKLEGRYIQGHPRKKNKQICKLQKEQKAIHNSSFGPKSISFQLFIVFIAFQHLACIKAVFVLLE